VKRAYEVLSDADARKALDELARVQRARAAKDATQDAKRRRMREELERREKQAARGESELQTARNALNAEVRVRCEKSCSCSCSCSSDSLSCRGLVGCRLGVTPAALLAGARVRRGW